MKREVFEIREGMTVYLEPTGNNKRNTKNKGVRKGIVTKIGRAYFYVTLDGCAWWENQKFSRKTFESFCDACNAGWILHASEKDYWERELALEKFHNMCRVFKVWGTCEISPETIDRIYKILLDDGVMPEYENVKELEERLEQLAG